MHTGVCITCIAAGASSVSMVWYKRIYNVHFYPQGSLARIQHPQIIKSRPGNLESQLVHSLMSRPIGPHTRHWNLPP